MIRLLAISLCVLVVIAGLVLMVDVQEQTSAASIFQDARPGDFITVSCYPDKGSRLHWIKEVRNSSEVLTAEEPGVMATNVYSGDRLTKNCQVRIIDKTHPAYSASANEFAMRVPGWKNPR